MSGSTENLLQNSQLSESAESVRTTNGNTGNNEKKSKNNVGNEGIVNPAFEGEVKHIEHHEISPSKHSAFPSSNRRHSSPDYGSHHFAKHKSKHGLNKHHRRSSASEEDLRRKAVMNSMKADAKYQSFSHLPYAAESETHEQNISDRKLSTKKNESQNPLQKEKDSKKDYLDCSNTAERHGSSSSTTSPRQEYYQEKDVLVALERAQLQQYKRRLTLALNERAKLTEQLQFLSANLSHNMSQSFDSSDMDGPRFASSPRIGHSPRQTQNNPNPRHLALSGVDDAVTERCLPPLPVKKDTYQIEQLNLEEVESSRIEEPTYSVRIVEPEHNGRTTSHRKQLHLSNSPKYHEPTAKSFDEHSLDRDDYKAVKSKESPAKENISLKADDIWRKHLRGESFSNDSDMVDGDVDKRVDKNKPESKDDKKPLTVEEFLLNDKEQKNQNEQKELDENDKALRRVLDSASEKHSPELYESLVHVDEKPTSSSKHSSTVKTYAPSSGAKRHDDDDSVAHSRKEGVMKSSKHHENDGDYEELMSTLARAHAHQKRAKSDLYEDMAASVEPKPDPHNYNHRTGQNDRRFNYMNPPGSANSHPNTRAISPSQGGSTSVREPERAPSNISDKLRYYRGTLGTDKRQESAAPSDLADAYANERDPVKKREIQQKAAAKAAILRREASELLFEAMNLERICDPNARVRHVYLPH